MTLTEAQFEQYQRDGYVVVEDCLDGETVERVATRIDEYVGNEREENEFQRMLEPEADSAVGGFEDDEFDPENPVSRNERAALNRLRAWADRVIEP